MRCTACSAESLDGMQFCEECGSPLSPRCPACGAEISPGKRFCGHCGAHLGTTTAAPRSAAPGALPDAAEESGVQSPRASELTTELRHVSVLFCDLVGFTPLAESRDPEEVRDLLSGYFDLARAIVTRYGGVVEKFIGDAVMAVWGAPTAKEDDAERAVRAGLELVSAVAAYGGSRGVELGARVGVATGERGNDRDGGGRNRDRRPRQHSRQDPGSSPPGIVLRRRDEQAVVGQRHRLRRRGTPPAQRESCP